MTDKLHKPLAMIDGLVAATPVGRGCRDCVFAEFVYEEGHWYPIQNGSCYEFIKAHNIDYLHPVFMKPEEFEPAELARVLLLGGGFSWRK